ncbi:MAG TPA: hypothetical protein VJP76_06830, partial [Candidatus Tumulicola sp.]|nr:hypothetical protein [Candidatus Tumulicola sp.]
AALHARTPLAAWAYLCVAGIADLRVFGHRPDRAPGGDGFGYALLAAASIVAGLRHGAGLVHPAMASALILAGIATAAAAWFQRRHRDSRARLAPAVVLAGLFVTAPPPAYRATETTMTDLFAGERLTFTGQLARDARGAALVRYAITCCRADAAPVVVRLAGAFPYSDGTWLRVDGSVAVADGRALLRADRFARIAPPSDPFVYR